MECETTRTRTGWVLAAIFAAVALAGVVWLATADRQLVREIPKRLAQGKDLKLENYVALGFRRAAVASVIIGVAGVASVGWWGRAVPGAPRTVGFPADSRPNPPPPGRRRPWRVVAVVGLAAMGVGLGLRAPRLVHSFWNDEAYAARAYVWGVNEVQADDSWRHRPVSWSQALFLNEKGNNHVACSIEARAAHWIWQRWGGGPDDRFSEAVMRAPAFVWGLLTIGALTVLGAMIAGRCGSLAGLLLAVHPWHVRFSVEMRGYAGMLLALVLGLIFLRLALRDGRWRWCLLAAAMNLWALLAFAGCVYVPLVATAGAIIGLIRTKRFIPMGRLLVANALAAVGFLWLFGPSIPQLAAYLKSGAEAGAYQIDRGWFESLWACLCLGADDRIMSAAWRDLTVVPSAAAAHWALVWVSAVFLWRLGLAVAAGWRRLLIPAAIFGAGLLGVVQNLGARSPVVVWYFLPLLPGWLLVMSGRRPVGVPPGTVWQRIIRAVDAAGLAGCLLLWTSYSLAMIRLPHQPLREAAVAAAGPAPVRVPASVCTGFQTAGPARPAAAWVTLPPTAETPPLTAAVGVSDRQMRLYDPAVHVVRTAVDLEAVEQLAATRHRPLVIAVCGWEESERRAPEVMNRLAGRAYRILADLPGWEPMFSYRLLYRPAD